MTPSSQWPPCRAGGRTFLHGLPFQRLATSTTSFYIGEKQHYPNLVCLIIPHVMHNNSTGGQSCPKLISYSAPSTAPGIKADGWASQVPVRGSRKWRDGYAVRYAVSYYLNRQETEKGPWWSPKGSDKEGYFAGSPDAFPTQTDLPIDPFYHAEGRRLYRQFKNIKEEMVATIKDNQTIEHLDKKK
jgi:hypothetical protein